MMLTVSAPKAYTLARTVLEHHALVLKRDLRLHLATASQRVLEQHPIVWRIYREGIRQGWASEFQRFKRRPTRPTPVDRAYFTIEDLARMLVAASDTPMTLRNAVVRVAESNPRLYERYARAIRRGRRSRPRK